MKKALFVLAITLLTSGSSFAQLVTNGGFETGTFDGWTQFGNTAFTDPNGTPNTGRFGADFGPTTYTGGSGGIQQTIATCAGCTYTLDFFMANGGGTPSSVNVSFGGLTLFSATDEDGYRYTEFTFTGLVVGNNATLMFDFLHDPDYYYLDDVTVTLTETPEPGSLALLGSGMLGLGGAIRRKLIAR